MAIIKVDFLRDLKERTLAELRAEGYTVDEGEELINLIRKYHNSLRRRILPQKRTVHFSKEVSARMFPAEIQNGLALIKQKTENGEDLNPHISKLIKKLDFNDLLINDWGVHHLHLGTTMESNGEYIERTGPLLFVLVRASDVYFIDVLEHHSFADNHLMEVVHKNWPHLIKAYRLNGIIELSQSISEEDRKKLRNAGVSTLLTSA